MDPNRAETHSQAALADAVRRLTSVLADRVELDRLDLWLAHAQTLRDTGPDGESVAFAFLEAGETLLTKLGRGELAEWAERSARLAELSPAVAAAFVRASPSIVAHSSAARLSWWSERGDALASSQWKSQALAARLFDEVRAMLEHARASEVEHVAQIIGELAQCSVDAASACLDVAARTLEQLRQSERAPFLALASTVARSAWVDVWFLLEHGPADLADIDEAVRVRFLTLMARLSSKSAVQGLPAFAEAAGSIGRLGAQAQHAALELAERIAQRSSTAALAFFGSAHEIHSRLDPDAARSWCNEGLALMAGDDKAAVRYFGLQSSRARELLASLAGRVELARVRPMLRLYVEAMSGQALDVEPLEALRERRMGWMSTASSATDGQSIYVPSHIDMFSEQSANVQAYKVHAMHQCGRLEFGTYDYVYGADGAYLNSSVRERERRERPAGIVAMERFFELFTQRALITWLFALVEDTRIDACVARGYPGLATWLHRVQAREADEREAPSMRGRRERFLDALLGTALGAAPPPRHDFGESLEHAVGMLEVVQRPHATVQDSAEAAARIYDLAVRIPNVVQRTAAADVREIPFQTPELPRYRGEPKAELVQLLLGEEEYRLEDIARLLERSVEIEHTDAGSPVIDAMAKRFRKTDELETKAASAEAAEDGEAAAPEEGVSWFFYDEWDDRAGDYRESWCRVGEREGTPGDAAYHDAVLDRRRGLANRIRRQFEALRPESVRRVTRLEDGHDIELDRAVTFHVDRKAGIGPLARIFMRRDAVERNIGVSFLVDVSASTEEPVAPDGLPSDPELRANLKLLGSGGAASERRVIDVEKEALILIAEALEVIGDRYAILTFCGAGRSDVRLNVVKDFDDPLQDAVKARIGGMEPMGATRMGAAVRHAASKLLQFDARTRLLILLSDGRPQDQGYGEREDHDYAVQDTRRALVEARTRGIIPFLITIGGAAEDFLRPACSDVGYERVQDLETLPERLPAIYRHLTSR